MSGIALDAESGLWLKPLYGPPAVPRIFPFDLLYLDKDQRVLESIEVFPEVELPVCPLEAESALLVPQKVLLATGTVRGDRLLVCPAKEIDQELARIGRSQSTAASANAGAVIRQTALTQPFAPPPEPARVLSIPASGNGHAKAGPLVDSNRPENASNRPDSQKPSKPEERREPSPVPVNAAAAAKTPAIDITEVLIEKPQSTSPLIGPVRHDPGDLFGNWVDSPAARPPWISHSPAAPSPQKLQKAASPASASRADAADMAQKRLTASHVFGSAKPVAERATAPETRVSPASPPPGQMKQTDARPESQPVTAKEPPQARPAQPATGLRTGGVPNPPSATTFTISQFGMWSVSPPTAVSPVVPSRRAGADKSANGERPKTPPPAQSQRIESSPATGAKAEDAPRTSVPSPMLYARATSEVRNPEPLVSRKPVESKDGSSDAPPALQKRTNVPAADSASSNASTVRPVLNPASSEPAIRNSATKTNEIQKPQIPGNASSLSDPQNKHAQSPRVAAPNAKKWGEAKPVETPSSAANQTREGVEKPQGEASMAVPLVQPQQKNTPAISSQPVGTNGKKEQDSYGLRARLKRWLHPVTPPSDRRRAYRRYVTGVVAHYYTGGAPKPFDVADISMSGLYLLTEDRWMPGTMIQMTLQKPCARGERKQSITVLSRIVRRGSDGVGAEFVMPESIDSRSHDVQPAQTTDRFALARFL